MVCKVIEVCQYEEGYICSKVGYWWWQKGTVWLLDLTYAQQKGWHWPLMMKLGWRKREMPPVTTRQEMRPNFQQHTF